MLLIYVLLLEGGKYYVGKTNNLDARLQEHFNGYGSTWTHSHQPLQILESFPQTSIFDEENKTREYMDKFGKENVRGGPWVQMRLPLDMENPYLLSRSREGRCIRCGFANHFVKDCFSKRTGDNGPILNSSLSRNFIPG